MAGNLCSDLSDFVCCQKRQKQQDGRERPLLQVNEQPLEEASDGSDCCGLRNLRDYLVKYCTRIYIAKGECYSIDEKALLKASRSGTMKVVSVFELLYVPYLLNMTLSSMCNVQVYTLFVTVQLGLRQRFIGYISLFTDLSNLIIQSTRYNDWTTDRLNMWDRNWIICFGSAFTSFLIALSPLGDLGAIVIAVAFLLRNFIPSGSFSTFRREWCDPADDSVGAGLQVGCRYLSVTLGVPVGIVVAAATFLSFRGVFMFASVAYLLLSWWSYLIARAANPSSSTTPQETETDTGTDSKWQVLYDNAGAAFKVLLFSVFTDFTRSTWPRTLTFVANASPLISNQISANINGACHVLSLLGILLTPHLLEGGKLVCFHVGTSGLRIASGLSFASLAIAHYLLSQAQTLSWFFASGIAFGLGEAFSCGLREDVRMISRRGLQAAGKDSKYIKKFDNGIAFLEKIVTMFIGFAIPYFGDPGIYGMKQVSDVLCCISVVGAMYSACLDEGSSTKKNKYKSRGTLHPNEIKVVHCPCF